MVILKDLFDMLAMGEFSNIALSRTNTGGINEREYEAVVGHINLGLVEIYKRFRFLQNEVALHVDPSVTEYFLRPERVADLHNISTKNYIQRPTNDDGCLNIIEVTGVFDSTGNPLVLNNRYKTPSIIQMSPDTLQIIGIDTAQILNILYQAHPAKIVIEDDFDPEDYAVHIPNTIVEALLFYVASRVYKPTGSNDSTASADKSASYEQKYELACQKLSLYGLDVQHDDEPDTFAEEGWA